MTKAIRYIFGRCFLLYIVAALLCWRLVDHHLVLIRVLNYWEPVVSSLFEYAKGSDPSNTPLLVHSIRYYKSIVKILPSAPSYGAIGFCYYHLGNKTKAIEYYQKAARTDPSFFGIHYDLGALYFDAGRYREAADTLQTALKTEPAFTVAYRGTVNPFDSVHAARNPQQMMAGLHRAYIETLKLLVASYRALKDDRSALTYAVSGLGGGERGDGFFYREAGVASFNLGNYPNAVEFLKQALALSDGQDAEAVQYLVKSLTALHQDALAEEVAKLAPSQKKTAVLFPSSAQPLFYYLPSFTMTVNGQNFEKM
jgi:tetratricopeptide (TPR) repeat protein